MRTLSLVLFLSLPLFAYGQSTPKAEQIDEMGEVCYEEFAARMDLFITRANSAVAGSKAVVIFYGRADMEGRNITLSRVIAQEYPRRRATKNIYLLRGSNRTEQQIEFWIVPPGADDPIPTEAHKEPTYAKTTLFDRAWADFNRWEGKGALNIYSDGFYDLGCDFSPNRGRFASILKSNPGLRAFLIVYTQKPNSLRGRKIASFALLDLVKNYKVARNRIRAIYGGVRKEPEIELWLVPKGQPDPKPRPNHPSIYSRDYSPEP